MVESLKDRGMIYETLFVTMHTIRRFKRSWYFLYLYLSPVVFVGPWVESAHFTAPDMNVQITCPSYRLQSV